LDKKTKDKYRDPDFLATLPNPYLRPAASVEANQHPDDAGNPEQGKKKVRRKAYSDMKPDRWAKKTLLDVSQSKSSSNWFLSGLIFFFS
jgi:hypothetical protein